MTTHGTLSRGKAHHCGQSGGSTEITAWRKAARSGQNGNCVEVKADGTSILIRDSKYLRDPNNDPELQPIISITRQQWRNFASVVAGKVDGTSEPHIDVGLDGSVTLLGAGGVLLGYTPAEWEAFSQGMVEGEFEDLVPVLSERGVAV